MKKILTLLVSILLTLCVSEAALRLVYPGGVAIDGEQRGWDWMQFDPITGWKNEAGYEHADFRINRQNFRGPEVQREPSEGRLRIICLGDSRTFGVWLDRGKMRFDNDYPAYLARALDKAGKNVEVINAGVIGYTGAHGLRQLMTKAADYDPRVMVVSFGFNDATPAWNPALRSHEPRSRLARSAYYALHDFRVFQLAAWAYQKIGVFHPEPKTNAWVDPEEYRRHLRRLVEVAREEGIRVLFLNQPIRDVDLGLSLPAYGDKPDRVVEKLGFGSLEELHETRRRYQAVMFDVAREEDVPVADAEAVFEAHIGRPLFGMYDLVHVNVQGATVIAETIRRKLTELGWL